MPRGTAVPSSRTPVSAVFTRGLVAAQKMPCFSNSGSPRYRPASLSSFGGLAVDLVVGHEDAAPPAAVRAVEQRGGVQRRARPGEEVEDQRVRAVPDDGLQAVLDRVERLRERERVAAPEQVRDQRRPVGAGVVRGPPPDGADTLDARARARLPVVERVAVGGLDVAPDADVARVDQLLHRVAPVAPGALVAFGVDREDREDVALAGRLPGIVELELGADALDGQRLLVDVDRVELPPAVGARAALRASAAQVEDAVVVGRRRSSPPDPRSRRRRRPPRRPLARRPDRRARVVLVAVLDVRELALGLIRRRRQGADHLAADARDGRDHEVGVLLDPARSWPSRCPSG